MESQPWVAERQTRVGELQAWIAEVLDSQAGWRRMKAEEYSDDARNARSAQALAGAAEYVRSLGPGKSPGLGGFVAFADAMEEVGERYATEPEALVSARHRTGRFGFDDSRVAYEDALRRLLDDSLEGWAEMLSGSQDQPPGSLVRFFEDAGFPVWQEDEEDDA